MLVLESNPGIVLTNPGNQTSSAGASASLPLVASAPYGDPLTYSATNLPLGLTINSSTGLISGTLTHTALTTYSVTVTATDGTLTTSQSFTWTVNVNTAAAGADESGQPDQRGQRDGVAAARRDRSGRDRPLLQRDRLTAGPDTEQRDWHDFRHAVQHDGDLRSDGDRVRRRALSSSQTFTWTVLLSSAFVQLNYATPQQDGGRPSPCPSRPRKPPAT